MTTSTHVRAGGHITLLFSVEKDAQLLRNQGSVGSGFSIEHGVALTGTLHRTDRSIRPRSEGAEPEPREAPFAPIESSVVVHDHLGEKVQDVSLYLDMIDACRQATLLRPDEWLTVGVELECPVSQGFGMSAAGLMALGRLIHELTQRGRWLQYLKLAHRIERQRGGGLGDVLGGSVGGIELRTAPGAPGWPGAATGFEASSPVLLVWDPSESRHTSTYIDDPTWQERITSAGRASVRVLAAAPWNIDAWPTLLEQSRMFATTSGLVDETARAHVYQDVMDALSSSGQAAVWAARLCMLGSSVAVLPKQLNAAGKEEDLQQVAVLLEEQGYDVLVTALAGVTTLDSVGKDR